jgi:hypothetical protein
MLSTNIGIQTQNARVQALMPVHRGTDKIIPILFDLSERDGYYKYTTRVNKHNIHVLPTQCIYMFCMGHRTNSDYFHIPD